MSTMNAFRRYVAIPFAFASMGATAIATIVVVGRTTGYRGKFETSGSMPNVTRSHERIQG